MASLAPVPPDPQQRTRSLTAAGQFNIVRQGVKRTIFGDLYHAALAAKWRTLLAAITAFYLASILLFAVVFWAAGDCIAGARPGVFEDDFAFSTHTLATIGYGSMTPRTTFANAVVTVEALYGLLMVATITGLFFGKFSRPTSRVHFSTVALVTMRDGEPYLVFRLANQRLSQIVDARLNVVMLRAEVTAEGERMRRMYDLPLVRESNPIFALTWVGMHRIDEKSPLWGATPTTLAEQEIEVFASVVGLDETVSQIVHARTSWVPSEIQWGGRFEDLFGRLPDGRRIIYIDRLDHFESDPALRPPWMR